ncbi:MAG: hypothetical protein QXQ31_06660, partial [Zestosphaera sp.]
VRGVGCERLDEEVGIIEVAAFRLIPLILVYLSMGVNVSKIETCIYINEDLWKEFEKIASSRDQELSEALEGLLREELIVDLEAAVRELVDELDAEQDFKPVKTEAPVSELVREMRNERENRLLGQQRHC